MKLLLTTKMRFAIECGCLSDCPRLTGPTALKGCDHIWTWRTFCSVLQNVSGRTLMWIFTLQVRGTLAERFSTPFSYTLHMSSMRNILKSKIVVYVKELSVLFSENNYCGLCHNSITSNPSRKKNTHHCCQKFQSISNTMRKANHINKLK
jgi:hypothetical protein